MRVATVITLLVMMSVFSMVGCSPDIEERETIITEEQIPSETPSFQGPHWMDGTITVRTGVYETGAEMARAIDNRRNFIIPTSGVRMAIMEIPMSKVPGETEVTVLTLREAGMTGTPTIAEVREHFRKEGYRPLTMEEAVMIRLDFTDQPETRTKHKMSKFETLLSREDGLSIGWQGNEWTFHIARSAGGDPIGQGYEIGFGQIYGGNVSLETAFACAKILP